MNIFRPPPKQCDTCGGLLKIFIVNREQHNTFSYVCEYHDHVKCLSMDEFMSNTPIQVHMHRQYHNNVTGYDFDGVRLDRQCISSIYNVDEGEKKYLTGGNVYTIKNIYMLRSGLLLRDYFEAGIWMIANPHVKNVWLWVK
jgi:hypothetical protein